MTFLLTFIVLSIINVIFSTVRSILTIKGGRLIASLTSGGYFAFYNIMLIYTVADFPMWQKCLITFFCNVIGVYIVKFVEDKAQKEKLWKVEMTVTAEQVEHLDRDLTFRDIPHNYVIAGPWAIFNIYCSTCEQSKTVKHFGEFYNAKYFASETKIL